MNKFKKGQIVVVNSPEEDDRQWHLRIYESKIARDIHKTYNPDKEDYDTWSLCKPAEDVWPGIFLFSDRLIIESCQEKDLAYVKTIENLCRRLVWLSEQLQAIRDRNGTQECPPNPYRDCRRGSCAECWEQASLKAVNVGESDE